MNTGVKGVKNVHHLHFDYRILKNVFSRLQLAGSGDMTVISMADFQTIKQYCLRSYVFWFGEIDSTYGIVNSTQFFKALCLWNLTVLDYVLLKYIMFVTHVVFVRSVKNVKKSVK